jgi:hypothetical protein
MRASWHQVLSRVTILSRISLGCDLGIGAGSGHRQGESVHIVTKAGEDLFGGASVAIAGRGSWTRPASRHGARFARHSWRTTAVVDSAQIASAPPDSPRLLVI